LLRDDFIFQQDSAPTVSQVGSHRLRIKRQNLAREIRHGNAKVSAERLTHPLSPCQDWFISLSRICVLTSALLIVAACVGQCQAELRDAVCIRCHRFRSLDTRAPQSTRRFSPVQRGVRPPRRRASLDVDIISVFMAVAAARWLWRRSRRHFAPFSGIVANVAPARWLRVSFDCD